MEHLEKSITMNSYGTKQTLRKGPCDNKENCQTQSQTKEYVVGASSGSSYGKKYVNIK